MTRSGDRDTQKSLGSTTKLQTARSQPVILSVTHKADLHLQALVELIYLVLQGGLYCCVVCKYPLLRMNRPIYGAQSIVRPLSRDAFSNPLESCFPIDNPRDL